MGIWSSGSAGALGWEILACIFFCLLFWLFFFFLFPFSFFLFVTRDHFQLDLCSCNFIIPPLTGLFSLLVHGFVWLALFPGGFFSLIQYPLGFACDILLIQCSQFFGSNSIYIVLMYSYFMSHEFTHQHST